MSLLVAIFYWIVIPVLVFLVARGLFRRATTLFQKRAVVAGSIVVFFGLLWIAAGEKWWLDYQVRELCAKDGGVKVYETVELTPNLLDWAGRIWISDKAQAKPLDKYYYESDIYYYLKGNPEMSRSQHRIIRRSDGKVLGELIRYGRGGGDLPGPWHGSSFMCPDPTQQPQLENLVFIKGDKK
jgi:hypothetical protein